MVSLPIFFFSLLWYPQERMFLHVPGPEALTLLRGASCILGAMKCVTQKQFGSPVSTLPLVFRATLPEKAM